MSSEHLTDIIVTDAKSGEIRFRAYQVEVVEGPDAGKSVRLERGTMIVGSASDADLRLTDGSVSRAHVRLVPFPDGIDVIDLGSKNGTTVGGVRIGQARLAPGSEITVGRSRIRLMPEDREAILEPSEHTRFAILRGRSRPMRQLFTVLELVAPRETPVLIEGEAGSGKMRVARAIHEQSPRRDRPLVVLDVRGDPAMDVAAKIPAGTGSVVLRDVDALEPSGQRALAAALEQRSIEARILATTRKDLEREAAGGRFDRALLLRLGVVRARVPPLRERGSDIPILIEDILEELGRPAFELGPADLGRLQAYAWPDNVRELYSVIERAVSLDSAALPSAAGGAGNAAAEVVGVDLPYKEARSQMIEAFEREYVRGLLARHDGNISKAARVAGIDRVYLHRLIRKYEL